jgi:hypothetical protein
VVEIQGENIDMFDNNWTDLETALEDEALKLVQPEQNSNRRLLSETTVKVTVSSMFEVGEFLGDENESFDIKLTNRLDLQFVQM